MTVADLFDVDRSDADDDRWLAEERAVLTAAWRDLKPTLDRAQRERDNALAAFQRMRTRRATRFANAIDDPLRRTVHSVRAMRDQLRSRPVAVGGPPADLPTPEEFRRAFAARLGAAGGLRVAVVASDRVAAAEPAGRFAPVAIDGLAAAIAAAGWTRTSDPGAADVVLVADPSVAIRDLARGPVLVAIVGDRGAARTMTDLDAYDLVIGPDAATCAGLEGNVAVLDPSTASADQASQGGDPVAGPWSAAALGAGLDRLLRGWAAGLRIGISIGIPSWTVAETWGDLHFARAMQRTFARRGHATRIHLLPEWADRVSARDDVAIHVFGLSERARLAGQRTILWVISHPERVTPAMLTGADRTYVASDLAAARLAEVTDRPVAPLHQATEPERFPIERTGPAHEVLFVGNTRGVRREMIENLVPTTFDLAVYGRGWEKQYPDAPFIRGEHVPNDALHRWYGSAAVVLNDHWPDMREAGFFSNRLYDALAAGAFVVSDVVAGMDEEFDGGVIGVTSPGDLRWTIHRALANPRARARIAERGRQAVLARHTFRHRVERILADLSGDLGHAPDPSLPIIEAPVRSST